MTESEARLPKAGKTRGAGGKARVKPQEVESAGETRGETPSPPDGELLTIVARSISLQSGAIDQLRKLKGQRDALRSENAQFEAGIARLSMEQMQLRDSVAKLGAELSAALASLKMAERERFEHLELAAKWDASLHEHERMRSRLAETEASRDVLRVQAEMAQVERDAFRRQLDGVLASLGWRISEACARLRHRLSTSIRYLAGRRDNPLFDRAWYLGAYPDVRVSRVDPYLHYLRHGQFEGRQPNAFFDPLWYRRENPDVASSSIEPLDHYRNFGGYEGRRPHPLFPLELGSVLAVVSGGPGRRTPLEAYLQLLKEASSGSVRM